MMNPINSLSGALTNAVIPRQLLVPPTEAWTLLLIILVLCCSLLWFLTRPARPHATRASASGPTRPTPGGSRRRKGLSSRRGRGPHPGLLLPSAPRHS